MPRIPSPKGVAREGDFYHVRYRDPGRFEEIRTPAYATTIAESVSKGSRVRMGRLPESGNWKVQSVLVRTGVGETKARELAERIIEKIEGD